MSIAATVLAIAGGRGTVWGYLRKASSSYLELLMGDRRVLHILRARGVSDRMAEQDRLCAVEYSRRTKEDVKVRLAIGVTAVRRARATAERERNIVAVSMPSCAGRGGELQVLVVLQRQPKLQRALTGSD